MLEIKPPVKDFYNWAMKQSDDIFIIYKTGESHGVCTHCLKQVEKGKNKWKHREKLTCPHCHKKAVLLCSGRFRDGRIENHRELLWYTQKTSKGCCMRLFYAYYHLCKNTHWELNPDASFQISPEWLVQIDVCEHGRYFLDVQGTVINSFEWGDFMQTHIPGWCRISTGAYSYEGKVFTGNYKQALSHYDCIKYMPWNKIKQILKEYAPPRIVKKAIQCPWVEYLVKMKLDKLAFHFLHSYHDELSVSEWLHPETKKPQSLAHILGLNRAQLNDIVPYNPTYAEFKLYKYLLGRKAGMQEWQQLKDYAKECADMISAMEYQPVSRYIRYINEQVPVYERHGAGDILAIISDYADYIRDAVNAEYNMEDTATINPRDLCVAHSDAREDERLKSYERNYFKYAEALAEKAAEVEKIKNIRLEGKEYIIAPIMSWEELFAESKYLRHCVASYADTYSEGRCIIIAVRRASSPQEPFVTVELSSDLKYIRQARGYKNRTPSEQVKEAIESWHKQLVAKNTKKAG